MGAPQAERNFWWEKLWHLDVEHRARSGAADIPLVETPRSGDEKFAFELLERLGISELAAKFPNECSGGERVRVSMARGLVHRPRWLWVDEPTASLDHTTGAQVMDVLKTQTQHGALVVVTHDLEILSDADVVFRMRDGILMETKPRTPS